jgi:hypothetical protein
MNHHPNVHEAWGRWSNEQTLHVACAYSNPFRWRARRELMNDFRHHMLATPNVCLYVGELAYGDRPFEVTSFVELGAKSTLLLSPRFLRLAVARLERKFYGHARQRSLVGIS